MHCNDKCCLSSGNAGTPGVITAGNSRIEFLKLLVPVGNVIVYRLGSPESGAGHSYDGGKSSTSLCYRSVYLQ